MEKTTVIFDMDGVIIDSEIVYLERLQKTLQNFGYQFSMSELNALAGRGLEDRIRYLIQTYKIPYGLEEIRGYYQKLIPQKQNYSEIAMPGVQKCFQALHRMRMRLAIASNSRMSHVQDVIRDCNLESYVDCIADGNSVTRKKPFPDVYLYAMEKMNVSARECLAVEDSTAGIEAAAGAGVDIIAKKDYRFCFRQDAAKYFIDDLSQLPQLVSSIVF